MILIPTAFWFPLSVVSCSLQVFPGYSEYITVLWKWIRKARQANSRQKQPAVVVWERSLKETFFPLWCFVRKPEDAWVTGMWGRGTASGNEMSLGPQMTQSTRGRITAGALRAPRRVPGVWERRLLKIHRGRRKWRLIGAQLGVLQFLLVTQSSWVCGGKGGDTGGNIYIYTLDQKLKGLELILRGGGLSFCWRGRKA